MLPSQQQEFTVTDVTDGDTVHIEGEAAGTRLGRFNTPEKFSPECEYEGQQGERASARLRELVAHGTARLTKVACACAPGTERNLDGAGGNSGRFPRRPYLLGRIVDEPPPSICFQLRREDGGPIAGATVTITCEVIGSSGPISLIENVHQTHWSLQEP